MHGPNAGRKYTVIPRLFPTHRYRYHGGMCVRFSDEITGTVTGIR